ncbi:hypothetical protein GcM1_241004 [Golovinomyces cichoracearum]|uniref:Ubiquitin-conjugating enzyme E2-binding protein n=1 Tax=Golovinomyces cichoracearum TaxID=62708 RepID=A0A420IHF2_9PEZI|nr:hypothetical protein GcM1_241004 [Golovinomyces cichoracearum]
MTTPSFSMYAELLINIRQISVLASLDTPCDSSTKIKLSEDGQQFSLFHNGQVNSLELPGKCFPNFRLQEPLLGSKELSWRLPWVGQKATDLDPLNPETPWSAKFMNSSKEFSCRACGEIILQRESIKTWKDLPSEDWAEMMDLWHCHKPNDNEEQCNPSNYADHPGPEDKTASSKSTLIDRAYGANSRFFAQPGTGLIDIMNFLLKEADCKNIRIEKSESKAYPVSCLCCQVELGYFDFDFLGIKLWKWRLQCIDLSTSSINLSSSLPTKLSRTVMKSINDRQSKPSAQIFITSKILSKMASHLFSKFVLTPTISTQNPRCLLLWIFGTSLRFSCSKSTRTTPVSYDQPAIKVFWKVILNDMGSKVRDSTGIEEIILPVDIVNEIEKILEENSLILPPSSRKYQEWSVGLLERYEE